jgi:hypothetical protein
MDDKPFFKDMGKFLLSGLVTWFIIVAEVVGVIEIARWAFGF